MGQQTNQTKSPGGGDFPRASTLWLTLDRACEPGWHSAACAVRTHQLLLDNFLICAALWMPMATSGLAV